MKNILSNLALTLPPLMKSCCKEAMSDNIKENNPDKKGLIKWLKRLGVAGFLFFLIKGLIWIAIFYGGLRLVGCES
jgi:hypothetical protein